MKSLAQKICILSTLTALAIAGTAFAGGDAVYNNTMTLESYEAALGDQAEGRASTGSVSYRNMMDIDRYVAALDDQSQDWGTYRNIYKLESFELALVDQREDAGVDLLAMEGSACGNDAVLTLARCEFR